MNKCFKYIGIVFLSCLIITACKEKKKSQVIESSQPTTTEWVKKTWNFGDMYQGEVLTYTYRFKNTGESNFIIKNVDSGCGCTTVNYDKAPLAPGKEGKFEITFNSIGRYGKQYKEICIFANVPEEQIILSFTANVKEKNN